MSLILDSPLLTQEEPQEAPATPRGLFQEPHGEDMVEIHRECSKRFYNHGTQPYPGSKEEKLQQLRRKRLLLARKLKAKRHQHATQVQDRLQQQHQPWIWHQRSSILQSAVDHHEWLTQTKRYRHRRKLAAAYRLAGLSLYHCDDTLALRWDISVDGDYCAVYHCFWDLTVNATNQYRLRLKQHTLPSCIPLGPILAQHLAEASVLDRLDKVSHVLPSLRQFANAVYRSCYCYHVRQRNLQYLQQHDDVSKCLLSHHSYQLAFELTVGLGSLHVTLIYKDTPLPSQVLVVNQVEESARDELVETAKIAFRRHAIAPAIAEVSTAMQEW